MEPLECFDNAKRSSLDVVDTHQEYTIAGMILTHSGSFLKRYEVGGI
jgi:hypothetical protein